LELACVPPLPVVLLLLTSASLHAQPAALQEGVFETRLTWEQHKTTIIATAGIVLLQSGLIVALLVERRSRRRSQIALRESEERAEIAGVSLGVGFWTWEPDSDHVWTTRQCAWLLGSEFGKPLTLEAFLDALRPQIGGSVQNTFEHAVRNGQPFDGEWPVTQSNGAVRWIAGATRPSADSRGRRHVTGVLLDVTARKAAELLAAEQRRALSHLNRAAMLGEMSGALAHELRQPLMAILSYAQGMRRLIEKQPPDLGKVLHGLDAIVKADKHAGAVLDRVRALLKRSDPEPEPLDINQAIRETLELASLEIRARTVATVTHLAGDLPKILGDRVQLQQVLMNVILNACEAMTEVIPAHRWLSVTTSHDEDQIQILVCDAGPGIQPQDADRVFEPFVTTKPHGLGLGLAICRSIVRAHGGEIRAFNNPEGGSTFQIFLPRPSGDAHCGMNGPDESEDPAVAYRRG
jgi:signal transduction histidine kinase